MTRSEDAPDLSVLAQHRAEDQKLIEDLIDEFWHQSFGGEMPYNPRWHEMCSQAADRLRDLSADLAEASHDRDRFHADLQRMKEAING